MFSFESVFRPQYRRLSAEFNVSKFEHACSNKNHAIINPGADLDYVCAIPNTWLYDGSESHHLLRGCSPLNPPPGSAFAIRVFAVQTTTPNVFLKSYMRLNSINKMMF